MTREIIRKRRRRFVRPLLELLEARIVFNTDFGDAPLPYKTLLAEGGASHNAVGPTLGANRDTEADGVHSAFAQGDDITGVPDDEDGVTFGTIRAGALGATATVRVSGGLAKLNAWIDFNRDGAWGGPGEHIADGRSVVSGDNNITFDVPSWAADGTTFARFRISGAGDLGPNGAAQNGEVEDYSITILPPKRACGCFSSAKDVTAAYGYAFSVHAADVDGDEDMDLLSADPLSDRISWYENDGNQNFAAHIIDNNATIATEVFAVDMDGDGDLDVLAADSYWGIRWYENDGNQNFTRHSLGGGFNLSAFPADLDLDGDMDVVAAASLPFFDGRIEWFENDGNANFTRYTLAASVNGARSVFAADVDGDGDTDVLSASSLNDAILWYRNDGNGNFIAFIITTDADGARDVHAADVDGDGDMDVLSASYYDDSIAWYENDGNETFTSHTLTAAANGAESVYAADVEGDGDLDVLSASRFDNKIAWYRNDGNQNFTTQVISTTATWAASVYATDVDGDGDLDVLAGSAGVDHVAWYENQRANKVGIQVDPVGPPIVPIPPPPAPIAQTRTLSAATARERKVSPRANGPDSELLNTSALDRTASDRRIRRIAALANAELNSLDAFFTDISMGTRLT